MTLLLSTYKIGGKSGATLGPGGKPAQGETIAAMFRTPNSKKKLAKLRPRLALRNSLLGLVLALIAGCSSIPLPSLPWSSPSAQPNATAEALYKEGMDYFNNKKYTAAVDRFQRLRSDYPFAPEVVSAELKLGEAYYRNEQYPEAIETLKEFSAMHPSNENMPYVLYLSGLAHFDQFSAVDRDQKSTEIAKGYFEKVVNSYPASPYAAQAREKLAKCLDYLAEHEFDIAAYYVREKKFPAARDRFEEILRRYNRTSTAPKALYQLGETYRLDKNNPKAALAYEALVQHYPTHPLAKNAQLQLSRLAQERQDPLALLLKPEGRAAPPVVAENKSSTGDGNLPPNLVAKTEVVNEQPGDEKGLFRRVVDKINPFSPSSPAPAATNGAEKKEPGAPQVAAASAGGNNKESSEGFFSSLWPFGKKLEPSKTASTKNPQLVGSIDESLKQRGVEVRPQNGGSSGRNSGSATQTLDLKPPAADLPQVSEAPPTAADPKVTLGAIDTKLEKTGRTIADLPPPPEAAPALKVRSDATSLRSKSPSAPAANTGALLSNIDEKLKRKGIDPAKVDEATKAESKKTEGKSGTGVASRPKREEEIKLEPRLSTEKKPLFLEPQEFQPQEKSQEKSPSAKPPDKSAPVEQSSTPSPPTTPTVQTLPEAVVKGPPQPAKERPAETKIAAKEKSGEEQEEQNKGVFDQLKEDFGRIGKILNPFSW